MHLDQSLGAKEKQSRPRITQFLICFVGEMVQYLMDMNTVATTVIWIDRIWPIAPLGHFTSKRHDGCPLQGPLP